jgi:hypothetical protein
MFIRASAPVVTASLLLLTACGTRVDFIPTNAPPRPLQPRPAAAVEVYTSQQPARPYVELGLVEARQESTLSLDDSAAVVAELREEAGEIGCEGIIVLGANDSVAGQISNGSGLVQTLKGYRATCFQYR